MTRGRGLSRAISLGTLLTTSGIGMVAFLYPFFRPPAAQQAGPVIAHAQDAPFLFVVLIVLTLGGVFADMNVRGLSPLSVAVMGVLAAIGAVLRLIPGPGGFSALFLVPLLGGYVYGAHFGFLLGVLTMVVSALVTAGVGPWLPFQMLATGWVGLLAGGWGWLVGRGRLEEGRPSRGEVIGLAFWGGLLGLGYGAVMNLWFWPFVFQAQQPELYWTPGLSWRETLARYAAFYLATSLWWDMGRAVGNALLILLVGPSAIRALRRFRARMRVVWEDTAQDPDRADLDPQDTTTEYGPSHIKGWKRDQRFRGGEI